MSNEQQRITRENTHEFFIKIPACLDWLDVDPHTFRLYAHYVRVAGAKEECYETTDTTANRIGFGRRTVQYKRKILAELNLIAYWEEPANSGPVSFMAS